MQDVVNIISSVGFPILFCLLMWKYFSDQTKRLEEVITDFKVTMIENNRLLTYIINNFMPDKKEDNDGN